ncbi:MAG: hypothetical protein RBG13Loki_0127 [Promethearchaeota archaeon CR_4]|nr:MAG: hypothetical protein RBG13Loki_0127 [Candidatus Lokiarchaeota archaeon CR_4]
MFQSFSFQYQLYVIFGIFLTGMYVMFVCVALRKYFQKSQRTTIYFALSNVAWCVTAVINTAYAWDYLLTSTRGVIYYISLPNEFIMTTISALFIFFFTTAMFKYKRRNELIVIIAGIILLVLIFLPFNNWFEPRGSGFSFQFISMLFVIVYAVTLYMIMAVLFIRLTQAKETPAYMKGIYLGAILFTIFLVLTTFAGILANTETGGYLMVVGWIPMILGSICLFYGFIKPTLNVK